MKYWLLVFLIIVPVAYAELNVTQNMNFNMSLNVSVNDTGFTIYTEAGTLNYNFTTPLNASYNIGFARAVNVSYNTSYNQTIVSNLSINLSCPAVSCNAEVITGNITSYIDTNVKPSQVRINELEAKRILAEDLLLFARDNATFFQKEFEVSRQKNYDCQQLLSKEERYTGWTYTISCILLLVLLALMVLYVKGSGGIGNSLGKQSMWV